MKKIKISLALMAFGLLVFWAPEDHGRQEMTPEGIGISTSAGGQNRIAGDFSLGKVPLYFIKNQGQADSKALYYAKASRYTLWMTHEGLIFDRAGNKTYKTFNRKGSMSRKITGESLRRDVSRICFINASKNPDIVSLEPSSLKVNFFKGNDPSNWKGDVPTSKAVLYRGLYNQIDLKVYGIEREIEYDWIVKPGGDPGDIRFEYSQVKGTRIDVDGNLRVQTEYGEMVHRCPVSFQMIPDENDPSSMKKVPVKSRFRKLGENVYGFEVGSYDRTRDLIIDPVVLLYSSYLGGALWDSISAIDVDGNGQVYVVGTTQSTDFPVINQYQPDQLSHDVFVAVFDTSQSGTNSLIYSTYLGGNDYDWGHDISYDSNGIVYVGGTTSSADFPILNPYQSSFDSNEGYLVKLDTTLGGSGLLYSTFFPAGIGCLVHGGNGIVYLSGLTSGTDLPLVNEYQSFPGDEGDAFVSKLDTNLGASGLLYSTYLGGDDYERADDITCDANGNVYVTGRTESTDFPVVNQYMTQPAGWNGDCFVSRIDTTQAGAASLIYSTYLGSSDEDAGKGIFFDKNGIVYVTGWAFESNFPMVNPYQTFGGHDDGFISKIDTNQSGSSSLLYSTHLGVAGTYAMDISLDRSGLVYVSGWIFDSSLPLLHHFQTYQGGIDGFVACIDPTIIGSDALVFSTYIGGNGDDLLDDMVLDDNRNIYIGGLTRSTDFPMQSQFMTDPGDNAEDGFVARVVLPYIEVTAPNNGEMWDNGSVQNITWNAPGLAPGSLVRIQLYHNGAKVGNIAGGLDASLGTYPWTVGSYIGGTVPAGPGYSIRIRVQDSTLIDVSDGPFTITDATPQITVLSPNGGESWGAGTTRDITWSSQGMTGSLVRIMLYRNSTKVGNIASNLNAMAGTYSWTVGSFIGGTAPAGSGYTIRIREQGTTVNDYSDAPFSITSATPEITVLSPNGGENWVAGTSHNITWSSQNLAPGALLRLQLYRNGAKVGNIAGNMDATLGTYSWTAGNYIGGTAPAGGGYTIRIRVQDTTLVDSSNASFNILSGV